ncbi:MAG: hypothetical protein ACON4Z_15890 [Planctomycetota bacterium]
MTGRPLRRGNWSVQELERLRLLLPHRGVAGTASLLRRSADSVQRKALTLLRAPRREGPWTQSEDLRLREAWGALEPRVLGPLLGRAVADVRRRAEVLRCQVRQGPWASEEQRVLKKFYGTRRDEDLEVCLQRPRADIRAAAKALCLAKDKRFRAQRAAPSPAALGRPSAMPRWTPAEVRRLEEIYPHQDNLTVARTLGRTVTSVANKAYQLGIKKSPALLADIGRANIARRYGGGERSAEA